ncbi:MAG: DEAD/DEAH box helicase [Candidatus Aphodosoma sp.]
MYFDELSLNDDILDALDDMNFVECTPIQEMAIPEIFAGKDLLASAQTGTGKTAAYLLPILEKISSGVLDVSKVNALILVPTRELAQQVDQLLSGFAFYLNVTWIPIFGGGDGVTFSQQQKALKAGCDIVVATPGRLISILRTYDIDLSALDMLVLDEADRMLDIGFYDDILEIVKYINHKCQTLLFSATYPKTVEKLALNILRNPAQVKISVSKPAEGIAQFICLINDKQKSALLCALAKSQSWKRAIIFASSKSSVKNLYKQLLRRKIKVAQIHSDLDNDARSDVILNFKNGKVDMLVATDVVARGINIDNVDVVVNYDVPSHPEDYVHRVGRTARAGATGVAFTFVNEKDKFRMAKIESFIDKEITRASVVDVLKDAVDLPVDNIESMRIKKKSRKNLPYCNRKNGRKNLEKAIPRRKYYSKNSSKTQNKQ